MKSLKCYITNFKQLQYLVSLNVGTYKALFDETLTVVTMGDVKCGGGGAILYLDITVHAGDMDSITDRELQDDVLGTDRVLCCAVDKGTLD